MSGNGYFRSSAGRALVLAAGVFLTGLGLSALLSASRGGTIVALLAPAAAVAACLACVGLGLDEYPLQSLLVTAATPLVLWPAFIAAGALRLVAPALGHVLVAAGIVVLAGFAVLCLKSSSHRTSAHGG